MLSTHHGGQEISYHSVGFSQSSPIWSVNLLFKLLWFIVIFLNLIFVSTVIGASSLHWPCPDPLLSTSPTHKHPWSNSSPSPSTADHQSRALKRDMLPCWWDRQGKTNRLLTETNGKSKEEAWKHIREMELVQRTNDRPQEKWRHCSFSTLLRLTFQTWPQQSYWIIILAIVPPTCSADTYRMAELRCNQRKSKEISHDLRRARTEEEAQEECMQGQAAFLLG